MPQIRWDFWWPRLPRDGARHPSIWRWSPVALGHLQDNWFAVGLESLGDDDSQPLLSLPNDFDTVMAAVSEDTKVAPSAPDNMEAGMAAVSELEHRCTLRFNTNMSDFRGEINLLRKDTRRLQQESGAQLELTKITRQQVAETESSLRLYIESANSSFAMALATITGNHSQSMADMQKKLQRSFDCMKYLEKTFQSVPELITTHMDAMLPATLTKALGSTIMPTLKMVLEASIPPTMALVLEGSFADF
jgi:hypothetical protein